jgi:hypothetical protein
MRIFKFFEEVNSMFNFIYKLFEDKIVLKKYEIGYLKINKEQYFKINIK